MQVGLARAYSYKKNYSRFIPVQNTAVNEDIIQEYKFGAERRADYWIAIKLPTKVIIKR